nr:acyl-CoA dehydrogenase family protein [uncultured Desulfuromonas sp.]
MIKTLVAAEHFTLIEKIRDLALTHVKPYAAQWDRDNCFPIEQVKALAGHGLLGICVEQQWGGLGKSLLEMALIIEGVARYDAGMALTLAAHSLVCDHVQQFGTAEQKSRYLSALASGEMIGAWALAEAGSGSDAASIQTRAEKKGQGWQINGRKMFVTQGSVAGLYVVLARSGDHKKSAISAFLVERDTLGVKPSAPLEKLGCRSSNTTAVHFDHVQLDAGQLLGEEHRGLAAAFNLLDHGRVTIAALACGIIRGCLEESQRHTARRQQFGTPINTFQAIQWPMADMATDYDAAWLLTARAAQLCDDGHPCGTAAAKAKLFAGERAVKSAERAVQLQGGYGYLKNSCVERFYRDAKLCDIGEGTAEIQRLVIAREMIERGA